MEREVAFALPVSIAGGWVAEASPILAAFQTSVEEDEGSLPRLSRRESKGLTQPTSVEGDEDGGGERGKRGWSEPPTPLLEMAEGAADTLLQSVCGGYCFTIRHYFQRDGRAWFAEFTPFVLFPANEDYTKAWLTFNIIPFWCTESPSVLLKLEAGLENPIWSIGNAQSSACWINKRAISVNGWTQGSKPGIGILSEMISHTLYTSTWL